MPAPSARPLLLSVVAVGALACSQTPPPSAAAAPVADEAASADAAPEGVPLAPADPFSFPELEGWSKDGDAQTYTPTTLFDYINGAAEAFLRMGFEELAALDYARVVGAAEQSLTVDVYRHSSNNTGFGIYRQERPSSGKALDIGAEATYVPGVLLFVKGAYYVKITGAGLGAGQESALESAAQLVSSRLEGAESLPEIISCFPGAAEVGQSVRYLHRAFLGHDFLGSTFAVEERLPEGVRRAFIIESSNAEAALATIERYAEHARAKGRPVKRVDGVYRFEDPYYAGDGPVTARVRGRYVWGVFAKDAQAAASYLREAERNLTRARLIR